MRLAVIADDCAVQRFALEALDAVEGTQEITVFSCKNSRYRRKWLTHGAYYALNYVAIRSPLTRFVPIASGKKRVAETIEFDSLYEGSWQALPHHVVEALNSGEFDVIIKLGMGLLRIPPDDQLPIPILSYHHGDPDRYRGRPAGFWEMVDAAPKLGQIIQVVGNRLDAGKVVAYAETKVLPWSYRATLAEAYRHSHFLINTAIRNARAGVYLPKACNGRNCRLPSNLRVLGFVARLAVQFVRRLAYGALVEKAWMVSIAPLRPGTLPALLEGADFPSTNSWRIIRSPPRYSFYADPFFCRAAGGILVEALSARTGIGEIVLIANGEHRPLISGKGHLSYPSTALIDGREVIVPESARWSDPAVYHPDEGRVRAAGTLLIEGQARVTDPTLVDRGERIYLFGNTPDHGSNVLHLWSSRSLKAVFVKHPASPIRLGPEGSRMGGALIESNGRLFRLGQDFSRGYGDGLIVFEIDQLTPESYSEHRIGAVRFEDRKGPHTLNFQGGEIVFDWYRDRFAPTAGIRRFLGRRGNAR